jgi:hypothetical protein
MLHKLRSRLTYANVVATIALFAAVATGGAYAANTVFSTDIVDGQVKSVDVGDNEIKSADVKDESLTTFDVSTFLGADVVDGSLTGADIQDESIGAADIGSQQVGPDEVLNDSLLQSDIRAGAVTSDEVLDNSLFGVDVQDGSLTSADIGFESVSATSAFDTSNPKTMDRTCPAGKVVIGGGFNTSLPVASENAAESFPLTSTTWHVGVNNVGPTTNWTLHAFAMCVTAP